MAILERLGDGYGSAVVGWLGPGVFYARFEQVISADVGLRFVRRFRSLLGDTIDVRYFGDSSAVTSYDLMALSMIMEALLEKRPQLASIVARPWLGGLSDRARALPEAFGNLELVGDAHEFNARLRAAAPAAGPLELTTLVSPSARPDSDAGALHVSSPARASSDGVAYSYAFDLRDFERGQFTARRFAHLAARPRDAWVCVARNDEQALALARSAAVSEWAAPLTRPPQRFSVTFLPPPPEPEALAPGPR